MFEYLLEYDRYFVLGAFAMLFLFWLVNNAFNPYGKVNGKLKRCRAKLIKKTDIDCLRKTTKPYYLSQWKMLALSRPNKASDVFVFEECRHKTKLVLSVFVSYTLLLFYLFVGILQNNREYVFVFVCAVLLSVIVVSSVKRHKQKCLVSARKKFAKFVVKLNGAFRKPLEDVLSRQTNFSGNDKAFDSLRNDLDTKRTVEEQRALNTALNGLLQSYVRNT